VSFIADLYQTAKKWNVLAGIIISDLITFIAYMIYSGGIFRLGDIQMVLGVAIGAYFALKNMKEYQTALKTGLITALGGSILAAISLSVFDWAIFSFVFPISFLDIFIYYFLEAVIIGLSIGLIEGLYFRMKKPKRLISDDDLDDDIFYESLKAK